MPDVVVLVSGGIKSATAAAREAKNHSVLLTHINYGQPSAQAEARAVGELARELHDAQAITLDIPYIAQIQRVKARNPRDTSGPPVTPVALRGFVPALLGVGGHVAVQFQASRVVLGMNAKSEDTLMSYTWSIGIEDTRRELTHAFNIVAESGFPARHGVRFDAPLIELSYAEVIRLAQSLNLSLADTWSCETRCDRPCETCPPCQARRRSFGEAHRGDPMRLGAR